MTSLPSTVRAPSTPAPARRPAARTESPRWVLPSLLALLAGTAVLYLWGLTASGYGNGYYAAAVQAGTQDWKAWLFGSLDSGNVITVDKPPASLWVTTAFARVFGFSSWTVLAPQALMGVAAVGLLHACVRRVAGPAAGLLAGAAFALTPVAALMFRFNNPDALLVLLLVAGAYCVVRATERASGRWLALAGVAIGFAFLTKMLQAFLVLPAFGLAYLLAAPTSLRGRLLHLLGACAALVVSAGWFVALVELWPTGSRPYIGGSDGDSLLELALGYNGLGRIVGGAGNGGGMGANMGGGNVGFGGETGLLRLFGDSFGTEISWLLPAALLGLGAGLWFTRRAPRTDRTRMALVLWGGWLLVTGLVFSFMSGTVHPYYAVALAPAVAALVAIAGQALWRGRHTLPARAVLAAMVAVTAVWDGVLLGRAPDFAPALRWGLLALGVLVATALLMGAHEFRRFAAVLATASALTLGLGNAAYAVATAAQPHTGSIPASGPSSRAMDGGFGGGPGGEQATSTELTALLAHTTTRWAAATSGAQSAASLSLASGKAVIAIGGFTGGDPAPTLEEFQAYAERGEIAYYVVGGGPGGGGGRGGSSAIAEWVAATFPATTVGGQTVYDLTG